jgi:hypothetical protein
MAEELTVTVVWSTTEQLNHRLMQRLVYSVIMNKLTLKQFSEIMTVLFKSDMDVVKYLPPKKTRPLEKHVYTSL